MSKIHAIQAEQAENEVTEMTAPRKMTFGENAVLTVKVLAAFGLLGAAIWGIDVWTAAR